MSSNKRASVVPAGPKPPTTIAPSAIIHDHASLTGTFPITIGPNTVLHPRAKILSTHGPVTIGQGCIICERSSIGLSSTPETSGPANAGVTIEDRVNVEVGAVVEARRVGMGCVIEVKACVGKDAVLGKVSILGLLAHQVEVNGGSLASIATLARCVKSVMERLCQNSRWCMERASVGSIDRGTRSGEWRRMRSTLRC